MSRQGAPPKLHLDAAVALALHAAFDQRADGADGVTRQQVAARVLDFWDNDGTRESAVGAKLNALVARVLARRERRGPNFVYTPLVRGGSSSARTAALRRRSSFSRRV